MLTLFWHTFTMWVAALCYGPVAVATKQIVSALRIVCKGVGSRRDHRVRSGDGAGNGLRAVLEDLRRQHTTHRVQRRRDGQRDAGR